MKTRTFRRFMFGAFAFAGLYLVVVGVWASLSVAELLPEAGRTEEPPPLTHRQTDMLLRIEDPRFFAHPGLDVSQGQGLTTITGSLARDIFLSGRDLVGVRGFFQSLYRSVFACCKRVDFGRDVMALVLDRHLSKEQQLRLFVSSVYMGRHERRAVVGLAAAAEAYFDKELPELSNEEFVTLVAMIKAPNRFHPVDGAGQLQSRVLRIQRILAGTCEASGWFDTDYAHCDSEDSPVPH